MEIDTSRVYRKSAKEIQFLLKLTKITKTLHEDGWIYTRVGTKVSGLTYKSRAKWKMLRGIYNAIYDYNVSVLVCVEIKEDYIEK
jgi:hypothetical protein